MSQCTSGEAPWSPNASRWSQSEVLGGTYAQFNLFIPANASKGKVPVLVYLSGLTCTEDNA